MQAVLAHLLACLGVLTEASAFYSCRTPGLPEDAKVVQPGQMVNLTCGMEVGSSNSSIEWRLNGNKKLQSGKQAAVNENVLVLQSIKLGDSGNYSCYRNGQLIKTHYVLVRDALEKPTMTCYRKMPTSNIKCDWSLSKKPASQINCSILVKKGYSGEPSEQSCRYYDRSKKFSCTVNHTEGDQVVYVVKMCVTNGTNAESSAEAVFTGDNIIKPDPPENVTVNPVQNAPQKLNVTWSYPKTWTTSFYRLRFRIRYRNERVQTFTTIQQLSKTFYMIEDAWVKSRHTVQVQAIEEFNNGKWSEWSEEATNTPWIEPENQAPTHPSSKTTTETEGPGDDYTEDYTCPTLDCSYIMKTSDVSEKSPAVPQYTFWIAGISLMAGIALFTLLITRYKKKWKKPISKEVKVTGASPHSIVHIVAEGRPTQEDFTLVSPPASPTSTSPTEDGFNNEDDAGPGPFDVMNMGYFLVPR